MFRGRKTRWERKLGREGVGGRKQQEYGLSLTKSLSKNN
jgi:hypothetical protein